MKEWRINNKEELKAYQKVYAKKYTDRIRTDPVLKEKVRKYQKEWREKNQSRARSSYYIRFYGITYEQAETLFKSQKGLCAICYKPLNFSSGRRGHDGPNIDHCHKTGKVRGVLCAHCNNMLGCAKDNLKTLSSAISYLKGHQYGA